ncbi:hypothetical protein CTEN210_06823 [Chaetoceros tenuissimus]|uniref:PCIF1 WW domain-containing protein n=1 Tax=Chaetoceros tenuissimus TaxID=426638 RepID=A0AAD3CQS2_9STRA|nr:hypothetical protein CTEN210_06823 [Chaetoceros tenuissimus]
MPKTKKSKKNIKKSNEKISISSLCNISGIQDELDPFASTNNELDDCLALMDQSLETTSTTETTKKESQASSSVIATTKLWKGPSSSSKSHTADNFSLPNIQVELARHKHIADLSKYLLSKAKHLRMPSFERWLLDSKMEERTKRMLIQEQANVESHQKKQDKKIKRLKRKRKDLQSNLERHLSSSGLRVQIDFDCVIPTMADVEDDASDRLEQEIKAGFDNDDEKDERMSPQEIVRELCDMACKAGRHLQNLSQHLGEVHSDHYFGNKSHSTTSSRIVLEVANNSSVDTQKSNDSEKDNKTYSLVYSRKAKGDGKKPKPFVVKINADHYEKLRIMFHHVHDTTKSTRPLHVPPALTIGTNPKQYSPATHIFHHLVFCMLIRYASLAGAQQLLDLRGGGMQGAIHSQVFDSIAQQGYENIMECFASPLNVYNSQYFSIFHQDLDVHFGSCGDFFSIPYNYFRKGGVHEANPPFSPGLMTKMIEKMEEHLMFADAMSSKGKECPLTFVVVVPSCSSKSRENLVQQFAWTSFNAMLRSRFMSRHIVLGARQHGYVEGAQHMRPTRFKESQYDTSVIILQSKDARKKAKDFAGNEFESQVRAAFASQHAQELEERRSHNDGKETTEHSQSDQDVEDEDSDKDEAVPVQSTTSNKSNKRKKEPREKKTKKSKKKRRKI